MSKRDNTEAASPIWLAHDPRFSLHRARGLHPERPERLAAIEAALARTAASFAAVSTREASPEELGRVHHEAFIAWLSGQKEAAHVDPDTYVNERSPEIARLAAGSAIEIVEHIIATPHHRGVAVIRPPGHHARPDRVMGFCLVNNVAVAAAHARSRGLERVAIIDFDVHHGNGTQDIFYEDETVLFASSHQMPLFPGTGELGETGAGNIFNAPLSDGDGGEVFKAAWRERILPAVDRFGPDLIIISAGFDAHRLDPLAGINLEAEDFDWVTGELMDLASRHCGNRIVSVLEGGYDLTGLATSVAAHVNRLMTG